MEVTIGSLDDPAAVPPLRNFGVESRLAWVAELVPGRLPDTTTEQFATRDRRQPAASGPRYAGRLETAHYIEG